MAFIPRPGFHEARVNLGRFTNRADWLLKIFQPIIVLKISFST